MRNSSALIGACLGACLMAVRPCEGEEKKEVRVYTNEDLERVRPFRDETGVASRTDTVTTDTGHAEASGQKLGGGRATERKARRSAEGEEHWRAAAERLRERLRPLRERADDVRLQIEERRRQPGVRPYSDPRVVALQRKLETLERRIREAESSFEDRARRQGVLPGWIR